MQKQCLLLFVVLVVAKVHGACMQQTLDATYTADTTSSVLRVIVPPGHGADYTIQYQLSGSKTVEAVIDGGASANATIVLNGNNEVVLTITDFDAVSPQGSAATHTSTSSSWVRFFAVSVASVLTLMFRGRVSSIIVIVCAYLLLSTATSFNGVHALDPSCTAHILLRVPKSLRLDLSSGGAAHVSCPAAYLRPNALAGCIYWQSRFSQIWADPNNDMACSAVQTSYDVFSPMGNSLALDINGPFVPFVSYQSPVKQPFSTALIPIGGETANMTFWLEPGQEVFSVVPVDVISSTRSCHFAFTCVSGDCLADINTDDSLCAEKQLVSPTVCNNVNCTFGAVKCTSYCNARPTPNSLSVTCNAGLCPGVGNEECSASGLCLCFNGGVLGAATSLVPSFSVVMAMASLLLLAAAQTM